MSTTAPEAHTQGPLTHASLNVKREVVYTRQQKGHSIIVQFFLLGAFTLWIVPIYYVVSPNHYYHL